MSLVSLAFHIWVFGTSLVSLAFYHHGHVILVSLVFSRISCISCCLSRPHLYWVYTVAHDIILIYKSRAPEHFAPKTFRPQDVSHPSLRRFAPLFRTFRSLRCDDLLQFKTFRPLPCKTFRTHGRRICDVSPPCVRRSALPPLRCSLPPPPLRRFAPRREDCLPPL